MIASQSTETSKCLVSEGEIVFGAARGTNVYLLRAQQRQGPERLINVDFLKAKILGLNLKVLTGPA